MHKNKGIENFSAIDSNKVYFNNSTVEITACDFDLNQKVLAVGLKDGGVKIMDPEKLTVRDVYMYGSNLQEKYPPVTAVNCRNSGKLIVSYANSLIKEFSMLDQSAINIFNPNKTSSPLKETNPENQIYANFIEYADSNDLILAAYNGKENSKIYCFKSGTENPLYEISLKNSPILCMNILNWARALITLSKNNNELNIYNYLNGELLASLQINIPSLTENNPITYFSILQITKQIRQVYMGDTEINSLESSDDSLQPAKSDLIVFSMENGTILSAYLSLKFTSGKISCSIIPHQTYKTQGKISVAIKNQGIRFIHIDPVTDRILLGDGECNIITFEKIILRALNPVKAKKYEEEKKQKSGGFWGKFGFSGFSLLDETVNIQQSTASPKSKEIVNTKKTSENIKHGEIELKENVKKSDISPEKLDD